MDYKDIDWASIDYTKVSEATGIDRTHIYRIFAHKVQPGLTNAVKICRALEIPLEVFIDFIQSQPIEHYYGKVSTARRRWQRDQNRALTRVSR